MTHPLKALVSSFPTRPVSAQSEFIWLPEQPQNRRYIFPGANPAKGRIKGDEELSVELHQVYLDRPRSPRSAAMIKEKAHALINQATVSPGYTAMRKPGFVIQIANDPEGDSAHSDHGQVA